MGKSFEELRDDGSIVVGGWLATRVNSLVYGNFGTFGTVLLDQNKRLDGRTMEEVASWNLVEYRIGRLVRGLFVPTSRRRGERVETRHELSRWWDLYTGEGVRPVEVFVGQNAVALTVEESAVLEVLANPPVQLGPIDEDNRLGL